MHFSCDGTIYCGQDKGQCRCGNCKGSKCGPNDGCPCNDCLNTLKKLHAIYISNCRVCPNGHPLKMMVVEEYHPNENQVYCSICSNDIKRSPSRRKLPVVCCDECNYRLCTMCVCDKSLPEWKNPLIGLAPPEPKPTNIHRSPCGVYYCGQNKKVCRCGYCKNCKCGPDEGCPCDDCSAILRKLHEMYLAHYRVCPNGHPLQIMTAEDYHPNEKETDCSKCHRNFKETASKRKMPVICCNVCNYRLCTMCISGRTLSEWENSLLGLAPSTKPGKVERDFGDNGLLYCCQEKGQCRCGYCSPWCGGVSMRYADGCPCNDCLGMLKKMYLEAGLKCPHGHPLNKIMTVEERNPEKKTIICSKCPARLGGTFQSEKYPILCCSECTYQLCPKCVFAITPSEYLNKARGGKYVPDPVIPGPEPKPDPKVIPGPEPKPDPKVIPEPEPKPDQPQPQPQPQQPLFHFAKNGLIYCGRSRSKCVCGGCGPICGPEEGCPCEECIARLVNAYKQSGIKCKWNHIIEPQYVSTYKDGMGIDCNECRERVGGMFSPKYTSGAVAMCCPNCSYELCPKCASSRLPQFLKDEAVSTCAQPQLQQGERFFAKNGLIYCGQKKNHCTCGKCGPTCGPDKGCPCDDCIRVLKGLYEQSGMKCDWNDPLEAKLVSEHRGGHGITCSECSCDCGGAFSEDYTKKALIMCCPNCTCELCPKCAMKRIPVQLARPYKK